MSSNKHPKGPEDREQGLGADTPRPPGDLERDPGIGTSKGTFARDKGGPEEIEADHTFEGDVMNDTNAQGGVNPNQQGRTNR
jgi:hypothetical protein